MPRFRNFSENMRNHRILVWVHIWERGLAMAYVKDVDKDIQDPWHLDDNLKYKKKKFGKRTVASIDMSERIRTEMELSNFLCYFEFPDLPKELAKEYKERKIEYKRKFNEMLQAKELSPFDTNKNIKKLKLRLGLLWWNNQDNDLFKHDYLQKIWEIKNKNVITELKRTCFKEVEEHNATKKQSVNYYNTINEEENLDEKGVIYED